MGAKEPKAGKLVESIGADRFVPKARTEGRWGSLPGILGGAILGTFFIRVGDFIPHISGIQGT